MATPEEIKSLLTQKWEEKQQEEALFTARALLEGLNQDLERVVEQVNAIKNDGNFDTIPVALKQALNQALVNAMAHRDADADPLIQAVYGWRSK